MNTLTLDSDEVCKILNVLSNAASVVRSETSADIEDQMILDLYKKAVENGLDVYPVVSDIYLDKVYKHIAKNDQEITRDAKFQTEKIVDEYPSYSRIHNDYAKNYDPQFFECQAIYKNDAQIDDFQLCYTIEFTLNNHKYGVDFNYSVPVGLHYYPCISVSIGLHDYRCISAFYSCDLSDEQEYYDREEVPYQIMDVIIETFGEVQNHIVNDQTRSYILWRLNNKLSKLDQDEHL